MANESLVQILVKMKDEASAQMDKLGNKFGMTKKSALALGAGMGAVGLAGMKLVSGARELNAQLGMTGMTIGMTEGQMRDLALSTTNVTFPLESVTATFDILARAGVRGKDAMKNTATAFDTLADATGSSAEVVASTLIPAYKAFGETLPTTAADLDKWTWLTKNTTVNLSDFGSVMNYLAPDMDQLNLSMDDAIAIMGALEAKGISGSAATKVFRSAVTEAAKGEVDLATALGLTSAEVDEYKGKMEDATGLTQEYADQANKQYGLMDKIKQKWSEISFRLGSTLTSLEPVFGLMTAMSPVLMLMSTGMGATAMNTGKATIAFIIQKGALIASSAATYAAAAAQWVLNAAMYAFPAFLIIAAIAAIGVAIWQLVAHWSAVTNALKVAWNAIVGFFKEAWGFIVGIFQENWQYLLAIFMPFIGIPILIAENWSTIVDFFGGLWESITGIFSGAWEAIKGFFEDAWNWISGTFMAGFSTLQGGFQAIWNGITGGFKAAINGIIGFLNGLITAFEKGLNAIGGAINKIPSFKLPSWIPAIGGKSFGLPKVPKVSLGRIPTLAEGGDIKEAGWAIVGEAGKELLNLPKGAGVTPLSGGRAVPAPLYVTVNVEGSVIAERDLTLKIREELLKIKSRNLTTGL